MTKYRTGFCILGWGFFVGKDYGGTWCVELHWQIWPNWASKRYYWGQWNWGR